MDCENWEKLEIWPKMSASWIQMRHPCDWLVRSVPDAEHSGLLDAQQRRFNLWLIYLLWGGKPSAVDVWVQLLKLNTEKKKKPQDWLSAPTWVRFSSFRSPASVSCVFPSHLNFGLWGASPAAPPWRSGRTSAFAVQTQPRLSDGRRCE